MGELLAKKPRYLKRLDPRIWASEIRSSSRGRLIRIVSLSIVFAGLMFFLSLITTEYVSAMWGPILSEENIFVEIESWSLVIFVTSIVFLPILEEWLFRGVILEEIAQMSSSQWIALGSSSLLFALFHLSNPGTNLVAVIPYTVGGLVLGVGYLIGGLSVAVLGHILYNLILVLPWF